MKYSDLHPDAQKLLARFRVLYPNPHGFKECVEAFDNVLCDGVTGTELMNAASGYRLYCQIKYGRSYSLSSFCMSAKSFLERGKYSEPWEDKAYYELGHERIEMADPEIDKQKKLLADAITERERKRIEELNLKAANAAEVEPNKLIKSLVKSKVL